MGNYTQGVSFYVILSVLNKTQSYLREAPSAQWTSNIGIVPLNQGFLPWVQNLVTQE